MVFANRLQSTMKSCHVGISLTIFCDLSLDTLNNGYIIARMGSQCHNVQNYIHYYKDKYDPLIINYATQSHKTVNLIEVIYTTIL